MFEEINYSGSHLSEIQYGKMEKVIQKFIWHESLLQ
jgi:hypothetical protein